VGDPKGQRAFMFAHAAEKELEVREAAGAAPLKMRRC
jgi:hypothetical protein